MIFIRGTLPSKDPFFVGLCVNGWRRAYMSCYICVEHCLPPFPM